MMNNDCGDVPEWMTMSEHTGMTTKTQHGLDDVLLGDPLQVRKYVKSKSNVSTTHKALRMPRLR